MRTSTVLFAVICAFGVYSAMADDAAVQNCVKSMTDDMQSIMGEMMSGGDPATMKKKFCPMLNKFFKCAMRGTFSKRPSDSQLKDLQKKLSQSTQSPQNIKCDINLNELADEVWNSAGVARPFSLLALAVAALSAFFVSRVL